MSSFKTSLQEYNELLHEFMSAVKQNYGENVLIQVWNYEFLLLAFEDLSMFIV